MMLKEAMSEQVDAFMEKVSQDNKNPQSITGYNDQLIEQVQSDLFQIRIDLQGLEKWYQRTGVHEYIHTVLRDLIALRRKNINYEYRDYFNAGIDKRDAYVKDLQEAVQEAKSILEKKDQGQSLMPLCTPDDLHQSVYELDKYINYLGHIRTDYVINITMGHDTYKKQLYLPMDGDNLYFFCQRLQIALDQCR